MKKCVKCDNQLNDDDVFCPKCGASQPSASDFAPGGVDPNPKRVGEEEAVIEEPHPYRERDKHYFTNGEIDYNSLPMWYDRPAFVYWIVSFISLGLIGVIFGALGVARSRNIKNKIFSRIALILSIMYLVFIITIYILVFLGVISASIFGLEYLFPQQN